MDTFKERREHKRVKPPRAMSTFSENQLSEVVDISASGLRLKGSFVGNNSSEYSLKLFTADFQFLISDIPVQIVWERTHGKYLNHIKEVGMRFNGLSGAQQQQIELILTPNLFWQSQCTNWDMKSDPASGY